MLHTRFGKCISNLFLETVFVEKQGVPKTYQRQSEENTKKELLDVIKMQIKGDTSQIDVAGYSDDTQSNLFNKTIYKFLKIS